MLRFASLLASLACLGLAPEAKAIPPAPPAPHTWARISWQCPGHQRSSIEIEQLAQGESGYRTSIVALSIAGREIDPVTVVGLADVLARRNFLRPAGGYCERTGEVIGIEELASGPKKDQAGWRRFYVPYGPTP